MVRVQGTNVALLTGATCIRNVLRDNDPGGFMFKTLIAIAYDRLTLATSYFQHFVLHHYTM